MIIRNPTYSIYFAILTCLASVHTFAVDFKIDSMNLRCSDIIEDKEGNITKLLFQADEIGKIREKFGPNARLPTEAEAKEICKALDNIHLRGVYPRADFEYTYQDFWICSNELENFVAYCPLAENDVVKKKNKEEKCCIRFIIDEKREAKALVEKKEPYAPWGSAAQLILSKCTVQNVYNFCSAAYFCYRAYQFFSSPETALKDRAKEILKFGYEAATALIIKSSLQGSGTVLFLKSPPDSGSPNM